MSKVAGSGGSSFARVLLFCFSVGREKRCSRKISSRPSEKGRKPTARPWKRCWPRLRSGRKSSAPAARLWPRCIPLRTWKISIICGIWASPGSIPSPGACSPTCTGGVFGPCGSTRGSPRRRTPTPAIASFWSKDPWAFRWPLTFPPRSATTPTTPWPRAKWGRWEFPSTPWRTWRSFSTRFPWTRSPRP